MVPLAGALLLAVDAGAVVCWLADSGTTFVIERVDLCLDAPDHGDYFIGDSVGMGLLGPWQIRPTQRPGAEGQSRPRAQGFAYRDGYGNLWSSMCTFMLPPDEKVHRQLLTLAAAV